MADFRTSFVERSEAKQGVANRRQAPFVQSSRQGVPARGAWQLFAKVH